MQPGNATPDRTNQNGRAASGAAPREEGSPSSAGRNDAIAVIAALGALATRFVYVLAGLPYIYHPDEPVNLRVVQEMVRNADPNPHFFFYPSLMFYANAPFQVLVRLVTGELVDFEIQSGGNGKTAQPWAFGLARATTLLVALAIVPVLDRWLRSLGLGWPSRVFVGVLYAFAPLLVEHACLVTPDLFAGLFATATLAACTRITQGGARGDYLVAGVCSGLAAASKYNAGAVALAIPVAHFVYSRRATDLRFLASAALASALAFLVACPFLLIDPDGIEHILSEVRHYKHGHPGASGNVVERNFHWIVTSLSWTPLLGALALVGPRLRALAPSVVFLLAYLALLGAQTVAFNRNLIPVLPTLILLSGVGLEQLGAWLSRRVQKPWLVQLAALSLGLYGFADPLALQIDDLTAFERDPGRPARRWLNALLPRGPGVLVGVESYVPFVDERGRRVESFTFAATGSERVQARLTHLVLARSASGRFERLPDHPGHERLRSLHRRACDSQSYPSADDPQITVLRFACE